MSLRLRQAQNSVVVCGFFLQMLFQIIVDYSSCIG